MRTLDEIVKAIRSGLPYTEEETRYAVVAYDVLIAQIYLDRNPVQLAEFFRAAETSPIEYVGWVNDPENPEAREWYVAMNNVGVETKG